jgi:hypothetical protein
MIPQYKTGGSFWRLAVLVGLAAWLTAAKPVLAQNPTASTPRLTRVLDAPLLFVKRHSYVGIHIYDTFYKWKPGGGIYVLENPSDPPEQHRVRAVIDPTTPETLGEGIYSDPELSWDGRRLLFCFKGEPAGSTSIYEIGVDGTGLRRLTDPCPCAADYRGSHGGVHDVSPAYLPDGRIVFTSTRQHGLVPCANEGVDILHVMNADGTDIHTLSVNNVNEFDPCVLPDGRILQGRWEYVDKTALTQQSLWTIFPDGTNETALYANNMVHPEALLDARPVPGMPHLIAASLTRHNAPPRGTIAILDTRRGKNRAEAITNFEYPDDPTFDQGDSCEPWPLSEEVILFSGRPPGRLYNAIEIMDRHGHRQVVHAEPDICCHSPMLIKSRRRPPILPTAKDRREVTGRLYVQDIYEGLTDVERGEVKWLRVIEETSRTSATPGGALNQTFLVSAVLAFSVKNYLGVVPVEADGSAYFEVPAGRALYLQALDDEGRLVQSMRTFIQAVPGVTRSCIGCHEHKYHTPANSGDRLAVLRQPVRPRPESWGSGFIDYPSMIQPILDKHCVRCHGGEEGIAAGMDLSSGWTEYFNVSYENLVTRRETQLTAHWIAGIDCMNGTSRWSAQIFPPRSHGSGAAPLAEILVAGHDERIANLSRTERDLLMAWIDTNGLYHGTWDYTDHGCTIRAWADVKNALIAEMQTAGCVRCHGHNGRVTRFENDWFNLQHPERSRILRAPLPAAAEGLGLGMCRDRKVDPGRQRIHILRTGNYLHADLPLESFAPQTPPPSDTAGEPVVSFASTSDPHYQSMLAIINDGRRRALAAPRADMPGAEIHAGSCRRLLPPSLPASLPTLEARVDGESLVHLTWERSAETIGLASEIHRSPQADFTPTDQTLVAATRRFEFTDAEAPQGLNHYALVLVADHQRSNPIRTAVGVPPLPEPPSPRGLKAVAAPGRIELRWLEQGDTCLRYHVDRAQAGSDQFARLTAEPVAQLQYTDVDLSAGVEHVYRVRAVNRRGAQSAASEPVTAAAMPEIKEPVLEASFAQDAKATVYGGGTVAGAVHGNGKVAGGMLDLRHGGHVTFPHRPEFDLNTRLSVEFWVYFTTEAQMPVVASCGHWRQAGWFLQRIGAGWRWHVGGIDCDGGTPAPGRWTHLVGTFDGHTTRLYQDGRQVAEQSGRIIRAPWNGPLHVGQYSGGRSAPYQVNGWISGLRIYNRVLTAEEAADASHGKPAAPQ